MKKTYVVTGALETSIGKAVVDRLIKENCHIIGTHQDDVTKQAPQIELYKVDHSSIDSINNFVEKINNKKIDGIVNTYMFFNMENPKSIDFNLWKKSIDINLAMPAILVNKLESNLLDDSSIVFISSTEAFRGSFGASAYAASKAAIHNLSMTLANNLGHRNIRCNSVAAGWIGGVMDTDMVFEMSKNITPLRRLGSPDEIASVVWFLLSKESSFVNSTTIIADGGYLGVDTIAKYEIENS